MNLIFTTDIKSNEATNCSLWWKIEGRFDSGCEEEDDEEDGDFVLQFSSDDSDGETSSSSNSDYSSTSSNNQITASTSFDKNCNHNLMMETNFESTTNLLNLDDKIASIRDKIRQKYTRKTSKNQRSVLDYFSRGDMRDGNIFPINKDRDLNKVVDMEKLIDQLLTARVILERIPNLTLVKNPALNDDQSQAALLRITKKYCPTCNKHVQTRKNTCCNCSSFLAFECPNCGLRFKARKYLARHKKLNCLDNPEVHRCTECKFSSLFRHNLLRHVRSVHTNSDDCRKRGSSMKNGKKRRMSSGDSKLTSKK